MSFPPQHLGLLCLNSITRICTYVHDAFPTTLWRCFIPKMPTFDIQEKDAHANAEEATVEGRRFLKSMKAPEFNSHRRLA